MIEYPWRISYFRPASNPTNKQEVGESYQRSVDPDHKIVWNLGTNKSHMVRSVVQRVKYTVAIWWFVLRCRERVGKGGAKPESVSVRLRQPRSAENSFPPTVTPIETSVVETIAGSTAAANYCKSIFTLFFDFLPSIKQGSLV
jgi:hypothetical protein